MPSTAPMLAMATAAGSVPSLSAGSSPSSIAMAPNQFTLTTAPASGWIGDRPAHDTSPSSRPPLRSRTAAMAASRPSTVPRSATMSASWRSTPMTGRPSASSSATSAAPSPEAEPVTTVDPGVSDICCCTPRWT